MAVEERECGNCTYYNKHADWCSKRELEVTYREICEGWEGKKVDKKNIDKVLNQQQICGKLIEIYEQKNADYNDSFAKARKEIKEYTLGKIYDKYERFKQLGRQENQVKSESIEDTLMDMANYAIMELLERGLDNENK